MVADGPAVPRRRYYDAIRGLRAPAVADFWTTPFVGVEVTQEYERVTSDDTLGCPVERRQSGWLGATAHRRSHVVARRARVEEAGA